MAQGKGEAVDPQAPASRRRPSGLGRGLSALLGDAGDAAGPASLTGASADALSGAAGAVRQVPVGDIRPHPRQPRRYFDDASLAELADSIAAQGVLQPILVRPAPDGRGFELVAGERRWRATQRAGLHDIPAMVRDLDDATTFTIALIENIQRADLTAIEEAEAYLRLRDELGHSAEAIGQMTGKSRSHVANILRLLELPEEVRAMVADGSLGMGHARALIGCGDARELARKVQREGLSVRAVEKLIRRRRNAESAAGNSRTRRQVKDGGDADIAALESHLADLLGLKVRIAHASNGTGELTLSYSSLDQLDMLCQRLSGESI